MALPVVRFGLSEIHDGGDRPAVDLVLVHGLNGHPQHSWTAPGSDFFWPKDLLPQHIAKEKVRILTYGYNANIDELLGNTSLDRIHHHAQTLVQKLWACRSTDDPECAVERPILFVCHCLGGIIVKKALELSNSIRHKNLEHLRSIYVSTFGIIFLGTPHHGADRDKWRCVLRSMSCATSYGQFHKPDSPLFAALSTSSEILQNINIAFTNIMNRFHIFFLYESLRTHASGFLDFIVDRESAAPVLDGTERASIEATHSNMCRFASSGSPGYDLIMEAVKRYAREAPAVVQKRWPEERGARERERQHEAAELLDSLQLLNQPTTAETSQESHGKKRFQQLPFERNGGFVGREDVIASIDSKFSSPVYNRRVALYGLGGIGKSQVALEYAHRLKEKSPQTSIFWIHGSSYPQFKQSYRDVANAAGIRSAEDPKVDLLGLVKNWFRSENSGDWLVILDNADDANLYFDDIRDPTDQAICEASSAKKTLFSYLPQSPKGLVLITSRSKAAATKITGGGAIILVERMSISESESLLNVKLDSEPADGSDTIRLLEELDSLPLCIAQVAAFCRETSQTVSEYLQAYRDSDSNKFELLSHEFGELARDSEVPNAVLSTWVISFNQIKRQDPRAADLISLMGFYDRHRIPEGLLRQQPDESIVAFRKAIGTLKSFSFITASSDNLSFNVHRLVHLSTRFWLSQNGEHEKWIKQALELLSERYPEGMHENRNTCAELLPHAQAVLTHDKAVQTNKVARATLLLLSSIYLQKYGELNEAHTGAVESLALREDVFGKEHSNTLASVNNLASVLQAQGKYEAAEEMNRRTLDGYEKVLGKEHPDTLISFSNLALVLRRRGKYEVAEEMNRRAVKGHEKVLGKGHPATLSGISNLALVLQLQGKLEVAEEMNRRALEGREKVLGKDHRTTLSSINNLALVLRLQGKFQVAEEMNRRALEGQEKMLGKDHPNTLASVNNLAIGLHIQGEDELAEKMTWRAVEGYEKVLGKDHPATLGSIDSLALILQAQGKYEVAEEMNRRAVEGHEKVLGKDHPDTLRSISNLALMLQRKGKLEVAEEMNWRAVKGHEEVLGREHPNTLASINSLASVLLWQGKYETAEEMSRQALEGFEKVLGEEHPDTLVSIYHLAYSLHKQKRWEEAIPLYKRAHEGIENTLGSAHPRAQNCAHNYTLLLEEMHKGGE